MLDLSSEHNVTLDEKYRISLPVAFRKELENSSLIITKGIEKCLWLFTSEKWNESIGVKMSHFTDPFSRGDRELRRRFVTPKQPITIDNAGRILLSEPLRTHAGIIKECVVAGAGDYIEIWDAQRYADRDNPENNADDAFYALSEELSRRIKLEKGIAL